MKSQDGVMVLAPYSIEHSEVQDSQDVMEFVPDSVQDSVFDLVVEDSYVEEDNGKDTENGDPADSLLMSAFPDDSQREEDEIELPPWTDIVKTGTLKELAPYDPDWYYIRAASMARKVYLRGGRIYGGSKRNGSRPPHFGKSSGSIARHILQQLEKMSIIDQVPKGGRVLTSSGRRDLDQVAGTIVVAP